MKVLVYGGGAVGLGLASALIHAGAAVDILAREDTALFLEREGLVRNGVFGSAHAPSDKFGILKCLSENSATVYEYILVCTKSYDSASAAEEISRHPTIMGEQSTIVLCQNGWGNAAVFNQLFAKQSLYNARIITGFQRRAPNSVEITVHVDAILMGSIYHQETRRIDPLCTAISQGGVPCESTPSIAKDLWAKMLYNCALNPLGAVFRVPYGELGKSVHTRAIMEAIIREIFEVMDRSGFRTDWQDAEEYLALFFNHLIPVTAKHEASTLQDIKAGKRTEIDALNGAVIHLGELHKVSVPVNRAITGMIKFLENQKERIG
jgi:2-dehydropantoate 2-reductase